MHQILLDNESISASSDVLTDAASYGFNTSTATLYVEVTSGSDIEIAWYGSVDGENFVFGGVIAEGVCTSCGPENDGKALLILDTLPIESIKFRVSNRGSATVTITLKIAIGTAPAPIYNIVDGISDAIDSVTKDGRIKTVEHVLLQPLLQAVTELKKIEYHLMIASDTELKDEDVD